MDEWIAWSLLSMSYQSSMMFFNLSLITLLMSIGVLYNTLPVVWSPAWPSSQGSLPLTSPSILELEVSLGLLSLCQWLDSTTPLPSPLFGEESLPSPPTSSPTLVLALTLSSPSRHSSPSPPTHWYLLSGPLWPDLITTSNEQLCTVRLSQRPGNRL